MLLREFIEKIDKDTPLRIMKAPDIDNVFKRENATDAIPDTLLDMKVRAIFTESELLYIYVQRNAKNGSFGEFCLDMFKYCDKLKGVKIKNPPANFEERSKLRPSQYTIVS